MSKRCCRWCGHFCKGTCPDARAAHERYAARRIAELEQHATEDSPVQRLARQAAADYADPLKREEIARSLFE